MKLNSFFKFESENILKATAKVLEFSLKAAGKFSKKSLLRFFYKIRKLKYISLHTKEHNFDYNKITKFLGKNTSELQEINVNLRKKRKLNKRFLEDNLMKVKNN